MVEKLDEFDEQPVACHLLNFSLNFLFSSLQSICQFYLSKFYEGRICYCFPTKISFYMLVIVIANLNFSITF